MAWRLRDAGIPSKSLPAVLVEVRKVHLKFYMGKQRN